MKVVIICKASPTTGFGHLIRSRTLANAIYDDRRISDLHFIAIGSKHISNLLPADKYTVDTYNDAAEVQLQANYDLAFFDCLSIEQEILQAIKSRCNTLVSLSPIFSEMDQMDLFFNRTKNTSESIMKLPIEKHLGLEYTLIQESCQKIPTAVYENNLDQDRLPIAISMGGGDAPNKTLRFLRSLKNCDVPVTFWVMLGEGYGHSYDELIEVVKGNTKHEIILAKTNQSMWQILRNCVLAILPGGITTYEAVYAGLPAINILDDASSYFLIEELENEKACFYGGALSDQTLDNLNKTLSHLYNNRLELINMHLKAKHLIKGRGGKEILDVCLSKMAV